MPLPTARLAGTIVGALTLVMYTISTGLRARIEDVVVDRAARGHGIGQALTNTALVIAKDHGARSIDLTSTPKRSPRISSTSSSDSHHASPRPTA
ncbi:MULTISPECIES: GNAT family N-acetyltransferase [Nocardia]|nr:MULTISPECIES: GNAT family N-acetyltransferase [Nocardia]MCZ9330415.1 GNAT family N-acetyltransferase [Nocardia farcinica]